MGFKKCDYCGKWETHWLLLPNDDWEKCVMCGKVYCDDCAPKGNNLKEYLTVAQRFPNGIPLDVLNILRSYGSPLLRVLENDRKTQLSYRFCARCIDLANEIIAKLLVVIEEWKRINIDSYNKPIIHPRDVRMVSCKYKGKISTVGARYNVESEWHDDKEDAWYNLAENAAKKGCDVVVSINTDVEYELNTPDTCDDVRTYTSNYMGDPQTEGEGEYISVWNYDTKGDAIEALKEEACSREYDVILDVEWERDGREWGCMGTAYNSGSHPIFRCSGVATSLKDDGAELQMPAVEEVLAVHYLKDRLVPTVNNLNKYSDCYSSVFNYKLLELRRQMIDHSYVLPNSGLLSDSSESFDLLSEIDSSKLRANLYKNMPFDKVCVAIAFGGNEVHHIVGNSPLEEDSRKILARLKVDINSAINGMFLCDRSPDSIYTRFPVHNGNHSASYKKEVYDRIRNCLTKEALIAELDCIKFAILEGRIKL